MSYVMLSDVHLGSRNCTVKARLVRFSDFMSTIEPGKRSRIDLILIDEQGNTMEGQVMESWHSRSRVKLEEDNVYVIRYFVVVKAKESFRPVPRECIIQFTPHTTIEEARHIPPEFPLYAHYAANFDVLRTRIDDDSVTSDTVAFLTGCGNVRDQNTQRSGVKRLRNLTISNGVETIRLALWGKHADNFEAELCMQPTVQKPVVLLLCALTCRRFNDKLYVQNSAVFRYYINPNIAEANALRNSQGAHVGPPVWLDGPPAIPEVEQITVAALASEHNPFELQNKRFLLIAKIKEIEPNRAWWYVACTRCNKKTKECGDSFKCSDYDCTSTQGTARYRLPLRVVDPDVALQDDSTPSVQIVFFGPMAEEIVGTPVHDLINSGGGVGAHLPQKIKDLYGKVVTVRVGVGRFSLRNVDLCLQVNNLISVSAPTEETSNKNETASIEISTPASEIENNTVLDARNETISEPSTTHTHLHTGIGLQTEEADIQVSNNSDHEAAKTPPTILHQVDMEGPKDSHSEVPATPPTNKKRPCPSKGEADAPQRKRQESSARRKLNLEKEPANE